MSLATPAAIASCGADRASQPAQDGGEHADATTQPDGDFVDDPVDGTIADAGLDARKKFEGGPYVCDVGPIVEVDGAGSPDAHACTADYYQRLLCGLPEDVIPQDCYLTLRDCARFCEKDGGYFNCRVTEGCIHGDGSESLVADAGPITVECVRCAAGGRRPAGLARASFSRASSAMGDYFARATHLEAASVPAFRSLRRELLALGAPRALVRAAARSARDEVRHARVTARLARRHGGTPVAPRVPRPARKCRSVEAIAIENVVEGCVRETFGALLATHQAARAADPDTRIAMDRIARDETRHAALAWAVAEFLDSRLDAAGRARVEDARIAALAELQKEVAVEPPPSLARSAGLPTGECSRALIAKMSLVLWGC